MRMKAFALMLGLGMTAAWAAQAQVVGLGSTTRGGTSQIGKQIAATVSEHSPLRMSPQELARTGDYMPLVNAGEIEFGISNVVQLDHAYRGFGMSEGTPMTDLRLAAVLMPFRAGFIVPASSDVQSVADLRGRNVPAFPPRELGAFVVGAYLANAGMTLEDVNGVSVPNFPRMWQSFEQGTTDVTVVVVGSGTNREMDQKLGGVRFLSFEEDGLAGMREWLPQMYLAEVGPDANIPGIAQPTNVMVYDYTFFANTQTADDDVYAAVKALYEQEEALLASGPFWNGFDGARMASDVGIPFHPGAIRFYKEVGIWKE